MKLQNSRILRATMLASLALFISFVSQADYKDSKSEKWHQITWCLANNGQLEVPLSDFSRVDCLTQLHAIEVEFAHKWKEALGQSLHYALLTNRKPGIVIILRNDKDDTYLKRLKKVIINYNLPVTTWETKLYTTAANNN